MIQIPLSRIFVKIDILGKLVGIHILIYLNILFISKLGDKLWFRVSGREVYEGYNRCWK